MREMISLNNIWKLLILFCQKVLQIRWNGRDKNERHKLTELTQEEILTRKALNVFLKIKFAVKIFQKENDKSKYIQCWILPQFKKEIISTPHKFFQKITEEGQHPNSFYKASSAIIPNQTRL